MHVWNLLCPVGVGLGGVGMGGGKERMTWLGEQNNVKKKGLDKMWGLRDNSMFPEMGGANCGR